MEEEKKQEKAASEERKNAPDTLVPKNTAVKYPLKLSKNDLISRAEMAI